MCGSFNLLNLLKSFRIETLVLAIFVQIVTEVLELGTILQTVEQVEQQAPLVSGQLLCRVDKLLGTRI